MFLYGQNMNLGIKVWFEFYIKFSGCINKWLNRREEKNFNNNFNWEEIGELERKRA